MIMENSTVCMECGCHCDSCLNNNSLHLHSEIEDLKKQVYTRDYRIVQMETSVLLEANKYPNGEYFALRNDINHWQEKYERLYESHKRLQKVNQGLEDKLLKIVDKYETEKVALTKDLTDITARLVEARVSIAELEEENERYRNDCNLAVQLLQCKPSSFVSHKMDTLPVDLQQKVKHHLNQKRRDFPNPTSHPPPDMRTIRVPIPTFPPTAMVYSINAKVINSSNENEEAVNGKSTDLVSAAIMAKVLEERAKERINKKANDQLCKCKSKVKSGFVSTEKGTQTQSANNPDSCDGEGVIFNGNNAQSLQYALGLHYGRTRTESCSSFDQRSLSRTGSTASSTETQI